MIEQNSRVEYFQITIGVYAVHINVPQQIVCLSMQFPEHLDNGKHMLQTGKQAYRISTQENALLHAREGRCAHVHAALETHILFG